MIGRWQKIYINAIALGFIIRMENSATDVTTDEDCCHR